MKRSLIKASLRFSVITFVNVVVSRFIFDKIFPWEQYVNLKQKPTYFLIAFG